MEYQDFPYEALSRELLDALRATFPLRSPRPGETNDSLMWLGGQQSVLEFLEAQFARNFPEDYHQQET